MAQAPPLSAASTRGQRKVLAQTMAGRLERMAAQVQDDLKHNRPVSVTCRDLGMAVLALAEELKELEVRDKIAAKDGAGLMRRSPLA